MAENKKKKGDWELSYDKKIPQQVGRRLQSSSPSKPNNPIARPVVGMQSQSTGANLGTTKKTALNNLDSSRNLQQAGQRITQPGPSNPNNPIAQPVVGIQSQSPVTNLGKAREITMITPAERNLGTPKYTTTSAQPVANLGTPKYTTTSASEAFVSSDPRMRAIEEMLRRHSDSYYENQEGILKIGLEQQLAELKMAYEEAVANGEMSIREAEKAFEEQASQINKLAYQDAERTNLLAERAGLSNSQQMIGLMQGDNARKNELVNANMSERDKRIQDIRDRINMITKQKDLDIARANAQYYAGLQSARAQADMMYSQGLFNLTSQDYFMNKQQEFDLEKMKVQNDYVLGQMAVQHGYDLEKMKVQHDYTIKQMLKGHELDLEKMDKQFDYDLQKMAKQFGYDQALQSQAHANAMAQIKAQAQHQMALAQKEYELARQRELAKYKQGTEEYEIMQNQLKAQRDAKLADIHTTSVYSALSNALLKDGILEKPKQSDYLELKNPILNFFGAAPKYELNESAYKEALKRYEEQQKFLKSVVPSW